MLSGSLDLSSLPRSLEYVNLSKNKFVGEIVLNRLPGELRALYLHKNELSGDLDLRYLQHSPNILWLNDNAFEGTLMVGERLFGRLKVRKNNRWKCVFHNGRKVSESTKIRRLE
eukprot:CAMPEP_0201523340 /NCGR_PEP_ID=MMETSP0161_2-20130828/19503_1 /ASSEMBLY_ACC=CAM_ASM_000251 /TAXON_ID=180227 /ORGANISM="Neoparamoeba aestuarina, Strain SoJaBio B1-5/56/2" /LENGTH=113 /DNA_ID=CAMNT_0047922437 /DNA_START=110 /DNA_END=451 /DNA_ORIENTATION=+